ncbi:MAG: hypothetical protein ACTHJP_00670 [Rhodanobacteraceae bacterium]
MESIDKLDAGQASGLPKLLTVLVGVAFALLLCVLFARTVQVAISQPPTFDGAMNLEVASSIAKGDGYRRNYAQRLPFPHEIQTGPPYILPSAAVFKLWGVGVTQAEVMNIVYLAFLLGMVYLLVAPLGGPLFALFAMCTVILIPGIQVYGFYGYGEIPALAWVFAATVAYFRRPGNVWVGLAAGVMLMLAAYTKTVMLIGVGALGLCAFADWLMAGRDRIRRLPRCIAFAGGGLLTIVAMEVWRATAVGGVHAWRRWWSNEAGNIFAQAGVRPGFGNYTHSLIDKLRTHFDLLSHDYRMSAVLTGLWLVLVAAAFGVTLRGALRRRTNWTTLTVMLIAAVYMVWWLLITPTAKAWHRRIIDGMICADVGLIMLVAAHFSDWRAGVRKRTSDVVAVLVGVLALALPVLWLVKGSHTLLMGEANPKTCSWRMASAVVCDQYNPGAGTDALLRVAREVRDLPDNAYVFGIGWYSAPQLGLISGRHFMDFNNLPVSRLQSGRPVYFVEGPDTPPAVLNRVRELYNLPETPDFAYAVIHVESMTPKPLLPAAAPVLRYINAADKYAYLRGFNRSEGANGRWLTDDNQVLLRPVAGDRFKMAIYVPPVAQYEYPEAPEVSVSFDGCRAPPQRVVPGQSNDLVFAIPDQCRVMAGQPTSVRIEVDNLINSSITHDQRALGVLAKSFGFAPSD